MRYRTHSDGPALVYHYTTFYRKIKSDTFNKRFAQMKITEYSGLELSEVGRDAEGLPVS